MISMPNLLLISGSSQNVGKTTLAIRLISKFSETTDLVAVKISPHFHKISNEIPELHRSNDFIIYQEIFPDKPKDTSRFLNAGAKKVFLVLTKKEMISKAFAELCKLLPPNTPVLCESGGLAKIIKPGLHLFLMNKNYPEKTGISIQKGTIILSFNGNSFDPDIEYVKWNKIKWNWSNIE
jgi:hypothetical protein